MEYIVQYIILYYLKYIILYNYLELSDITQSPKTLQKILQKLIAISLILISITFQNGESTFVFTIFL